MDEKSCTKKDALMYLLGLKKFTENYDFDSNVLELEKNKMSLEDFLIDKTKRAYINYKNAEFIRTRAVDYLCDMDDELANLNDSKIDFSTIANNERLVIVDKYIDKLKSINPILLLSENEFDKQVEPRKENESRALYKKREQEMAKANLAKVEKDGYLRDINVELTNLITSRLTGDSRAIFEKRLKNIVEAEHEKYEAIISLKTKTRVYLCAIEDELNKKDNKQLQIDDCTTDTNHPYITLFSLKHWAQIYLGISILDEIDLFIPKTHQNLPEQNVEPADKKSWSQINLVQAQLNVNKYKTFVVDLVVPTSSKKHWDTPNPYDPEVKPGENWMTAARYLARKYLADNPGLSITKKKLALKVAELMVANNIFHSGKSPYQDSTIRKAFRYVSF